jgi:hypothetical protein
METWQPPSITVVPAITQAGAPQGLDSAVANNHGYVQFNLVGPTVAQFSFIGISNPNASGKRFYLDGIVWNKIAPTATDLWSAYVAVGTGASLGALFNKRTGVADSTCVLRGGTQVASFGGGIPNEDSLGPPVVAVGTTGIVVRQFSEGPYIIEPNSMLVFWQQPVNLQLFMGFFGREY